jgi:hypothetical protein
MKPQMAPPTKPAKGHGEQHDRFGRLRREHMEGDASGEKCAHEQLTFSADVPELHAKGD